MSETKEESLVYILKFHSEDIKWHREDIVNKVRRKQYDRQFKLILMSHLERFKGYQELSDVTGIDVGILKEGQGVNIDYGVYCRNLLGICFREYCLGSISDRCYLERIIILTLQVNASTQL